MCLAGTRLPDSVRAISMAECFKQAVLEDTSSYLDVCLVDTLFHTYVYTCLFIRSRSRYGSGHVGDYIWCNLFFSGWLQDISENACMTRMSPHL